MEYVNMHVRGKDRQH